MLLSRLKSLSPRAGLHIFAGLMCFALVACETTGPAPGPDPRPNRPVIDVPDTPDIPDAKPEETEPEETGTPDIMTDSGLTLPHMKGRTIRRVALLLPFSASSDRARTEAAGMLQAAEMAVFDQDKADILLIAKDTGGTAQGAQTAARAALDEGADVILGPLFANNVRAISADARKDGVPVLAFSTDRSVAGGGVYLMSFPPEAEVTRITRFARDSGVNRFAYLGPQNGYGRTVLQAYEGEISRTGGSIVAQQTYSGSSVNDMTEPARQLARSKDLFQAVMLPEGGNRLLSLAPLMPYNDVDPRQVKFLGTGRWNDESVAREPALQGGWFAGPDPEARASFENDFARDYGTEPSALASLAYDGVNVAAWIASGKDSERYARVTNEDGFYGADGLFRFRPDGLPERGLAIFEVRSGAFDVIDPAPVKFGPAGTN